MKSKFMILLALYFGRKYNWIGPDVQAMETQHPLLIQILQKYPKLHLK